MILLSRAELASYDCKLLIEQLSDSVIVLTDASLQANLTSFCLQRYKWGGSDGETRLI